MNDKPKIYTPPLVWNWQDATEGKPPSLNRPVAGPTHESTLSIGQHPFQLYSLGTPNGMKVAILFEELLEAGFRGAEYDAWNIDIGEGDQFGSGFVAINPNSKIPAMVDRRGTTPIPIFESGAILLYLAEIFGAFIPIEPANRAKVLSWVFWQVGSGPFVGGGFGHFYESAPEKLEYPINRYAMETKRQLDVLDRTLSENEFIAGESYSIADMAIWPWYGLLTRGEFYDAKEFLQLECYSNLQRWTKQLAERPAIQRGYRVNGIFGDPAVRLHERHDSADFENRV